MAIIEIKNLYKSYGRRLILDNLSLEANTGEVLGLLGPNGAGKTTLIKSIVGLISYDQGTIKINGHDREKEFTQAMQNVSAIVENPEMYTYMSGMSNLMQYARMHGLKDKDKINNIVALVGLTDRINDKVKRYSLGMKQRLGIALALLNEPKVMILDEPTNGLDPAGIRQLRNILRNIAKQNDVCIIVSSHLMSEMELMCDKVAIVNNKTIQTVATINELKAQVSGNYSSYIYNVERTDSIESIAKEVFAEELSKFNECLKPKVADNIVESNTGESVDSNSTNAINSNTENVSEPKVVPNSYIPYKLMILDQTHFQIDVLNDIALFKISDLNKAIILKDIRLFSASYKEDIRLEDAFLQMTSGGGNNA